MLHELISLINVVIWPAIVLFFLCRFGTAINRFLENLSRLSIKGPGFEVEAFNKGAESSANLAAALASKGTIVKGDDNVEQSVLDDVNVVTQVVTPRVLQRAGETVILWVDDRPNGNRYERQSMEALGIRFVNVVSTDEALERLKNQSFDVIISDMKRPGDDRAGYTLLDELRRKGKDIPYIIYASSNSAQHKEQAKQHGALDATNNPPELFRLVMGALKK